MNIWITCAATLLFLHFALAGAYILRRLHPPRRLAPVAATGTGVVRKVSLFIYIFS
jgi:hypothetical protein